jgi:uncharacterized protein (TIGR02145 family)
MKNSVLLLLIILFSACVDKEFDNNYDPQELPKPYIVEIKQTIDGVYIEWSNSDSNIDSYLLEKQEVGSLWNRLTEITDYSRKSFTDSDINTGATYNYRISIKAGQNQSDYTTISIATREVGTVNDYDGNSYYWIKLGTQIWMTENLKTTYSPNGDIIPYVTSNEVWKNLDENDDAYCYYDNSTENKNLYGALYTYKSAKNACPSGWHLPTDAEWTKLELYVAQDGHSGAEGTALKASIGWNNNENGTDNYNFKALPGGIRWGGDGTFNDVGSEGIWLSSTESSLGVYVRLLNNYSSLNRSHRYMMSNGFSVRCVKD